MRDRLPGCPTRERLAVSGAVGVPGRPSASSGLRERVCRAWLLVTVLVQRHQRLGRRSLVLAERCLHTCPPTTTVRRIGDACTGPGPRGSRGWASASSASPRPPVSPRHGSVRSWGQARHPNDTALRLSKALGVDDRFWIDIQTDYDLEVERDLHADDLAKVTALVPS